ncbi:hypothetical protein SDC9_191604 [bioreactor metagenome]|uniref:Uncharacterized protein n=1 Tax=bioreactor metagenome TaxID=1076179 RepID=A0A645I9E6_9ZZZZ
MASIVAPGNSKPIDMPKNAIATIIEMPTSVQKAFIQSCPFLDVQAYIKMTVGR